MGDSLKARLIGVATVVTGIGSLLVTKVYAAVPTFTTTDVDAMATPSFQSIKDFLLYLAVTFGPWLIAIISFVVVLLLARRIIAKGGSTVSHN